VTLSNVFVVGETAPHGPHGQAVGSIGASYPRPTSKRRWTRQALARPARRLERHPLDTAHRSTLEGPSRTLPTLPNLPPPFSEVDRARGFEQRARSSSSRSRGAWAHRPLGVLHRRHVCSGQKRGACVGKTKRGKGTKIMAFSDGSSVPLALYTESASPHEISLVEQTLASAFLGEHHKPKRLIGEKAYDSDPLDETLLEMGIEMIAPHRRSRKKRKTQDGRKLRRYKRRWKVERLFAWLQNFRRLVVRYEYKNENFLGMAQLGCIVILLRKCL
jgi:transposase